MPKGSEHLVILGVIAVAAWLLATYLYPRLMLIAYKRAILVKGVDSGPIPVNTLYTQPQALFRDPFAPLPPGGSRLMSMGTNRDTLYVVGWLDLSTGPLVLHVPDMGDRYYSMQFTDSATNTNFAYVGTRTTGTASGHHLVSGPRWTGTVPDGMGHVPSPHNAVLLSDACSSPPTMTSRPHTPSPSRSASRRWRPRACFGTGICAWGVRFVLVVGRGDLTDAAWAVLEPLLPVAVTGRRARNRRVQINGIRWRIRVGCPWRDVPERFGPWQSLYRVFRSWQRDGTWRAIVRQLQTLADAAEAICWEFNVDSTIARAHQHAAGARRDGAGQVEPPGGVATEPADHGLGRSRGGWTSKVHAVAEQGQKLMAVIVTAGQRGDSPQFQPVLGMVAVKRHCGVGRPRTRPVRVRADKAYASAGNRAYLRRRGIRATIPQKKDQQAHRRAKGARGGRPPLVDHADYKLRHAVECMFNRLKRWRAVATRYDKLAVRYEATVLIAAMDDWLTAVA